MSIRQLEIRTGMPIGTIKSWKKAIPAGDKILLISTHLNISTDYLFDRTNDPEAHQKSNYTQATMKLIQFSENKKISLYLANIAISVLEALLNAKPE